RPFGPGRGRFSVMRRGTVFRLSVMFFIPEKSGVLVWNSFLMFLLWFQNGKDRGPRVSVGGAFRF
ncbi:hypothetical protein DZC11_23830, partial [Salmonella enterica]|nr:hypothetical protein [Salmonella enterica]